MKTLLLAFFTFLSTQLEAQKAFQHNDASKYGIRTTQLDSTYKSAIHTDPTLAVFKNIDEVSKAYDKLLQDFGTFLYKNNFYWEQKTTGFNRIYFNADGRIDYFVYSFRGTPMSTEQLGRFNELLNLFIQDYRFPMTATEKFAQCSPVNYAPTAKE